MSFVAVTHDATGPARALYRRILTSDKHLKAQVRFDVTVLDKYREAGVSVKRSDTVGRVKAAAWLLDFGIAPDEQSVHASLGDLLRLPESERQHWAQHVYAEGLSANFLSITLNPGSCFDDGNTRDW